MLLKRSFFPFLLLLLLLMVNAACRNEEPTPTPTPPADTGESTPTAVSFGLIPGDYDALPEPQVVGQNPAVGAEAALDDVFEVYFDQPMDRQATTAAWQMVDSTGESIEGEVSWPQPRVLRFMPGRRLKPDTSYLASLDETAASAAGVPLTDGLSLTFSTIGDLAVSQVSPAPGAADVAIDSAITVIFNRPVVPLGIAEEQADLPDPLQITPQTAGQGEWINTSVYVFRPRDPLSGRRTYTVRVTAGVINEISAAGAQMTADYESSFTVTAPTIQRLDLVDRTSSPRDGYTDLPLDQSYRLLFSQPMDPSSTRDAISLAPGDGGPAVPFEFDWNEAFNTVVFTPTQLLELGTVYTLRVDDTALSSHGGRLRQSLTWHATTVRPPAIVATSPADGTTQDRYTGVFRLQFASPMDQESLAGKVVFRPPLGDDVEGQYDRWDWSLNFHGLEPSTAYTVQILPGMADAYGNVISQERTIRFTTAPYAPYASFNFPGRLALYRYGGSTAVWITYRNLERLDADLYHITPSQLDGLLHGSLNQVDYVPDATNQVWSQSLDVSAQVNATGRQRLDLFTADDAGNIQEDDLLPPGLYFITLDSPQIEHEYRHLQAHVLVVATANVTLKTTASEAMMWLTDLTTGEPLADVPVALFDDDFNAVFRDTTDANGLVYQDGLDLERGFQERYYAISEDPDGSALGVAISNWSDGVRPYEFGIFTDYYVEPERPTAYVYTDRPVYRPGQPVSFKGIVRLNDDLDYGLPGYEAVDVTIASYDETVFSDTVPLSEFGTFDAQVTLDDEAALGSYRIGVSVSEEQIGSGRFQVAEYRKPTFQVEVTASEEGVAAGDTIDLTAEAQFFSGGSVVNGDVEWAVRSSPYTFSGEGTLGRYSFSNEDYYDGLGYQPGEIIARGQGQTDTRGRFTFQVPAQLSEEDGSRRFDIEATVTDIADNAVSGRTSVVVHRSQFYPGIKTDRYVGQVDEEMTLDLVVLDWGGEPVPDRPVMVEVVERRWYSVQEENEFGQTVWRTDVEEIPVDGFTDVAMGDDGRASVTFVPPSGGVYRAYVTVQDDEGNETTSSTYVWVAGSDYVSWRQMNDHSFELVSDADHYQPGDTAELLIASPFQGEATALVTVERGHIKHYETIELSNNSTIYRLPVTGDMAPNAFVSVLVIKGVDETNPSPDFKVGMAQFTVEREQQQLEVGLVPDRITAGPGDTVTYTVQVQDFRGRPVEAEVSLALADLAALSLAEPQVPSILDYFYSERWLSVETALLLTRIMDAFNQELEEPKGGGGGPGELGVMTVREEFPDTAYWEGQLQTGPDGEATVTVTLPDNLTTWRMEARAVTLDTKVGQAQVDIMTTRPLLLSPRAPRFFVVGDTAQVGTAVHNNTDSDIEATVTLQAEGVTLNSPGSQRLTVPARQQVQVTWEVVVEDVERVDFVFSANGNDANGNDYFDASRPTLGSLDGQGIPVYRYQVPETVGTSGQLMEDGVVVESIGLPIFPDFELTEGEVTVEVAPSLAAAMTEGLTYLEHYPYECTEQVVSRFLPNVLTSRALQAAGLSDPELEANLEERVNVALQRLYNRQRPDGGWPWWDEQDSNTLVTAYVVLGLLQAQESGYNVSQDVIAQGVSYLRDDLPQVDDLDGRYKFNRQAFLTYVLARAGVPATGTVNRLYDQREAIDWYARGFLAQAMQLTDEADPRLETMAADFVSSAILSATGAHWEEAERDFWNWNSDTRTTAIVLDTMIKLDPQNPVVANAVRWLMAHRQNGRWQSTQETAWTIMALTEWMVASGELEADYAYEVALNGDLLGSGRANAGTLRHSQQMRVDITELFTDELNRLAIGRSEGPGNLYYTTHLQATLPVEQVPALDRGITISRRYYDPADRETPITEIEQGQIFLARLTVIVPEALHYVLIDDFLPAGLEAVDTSLRTSQHVGAPQRYDWDENFSQGWGWWVFNHVELRDEKVVLSADYLPAGTYEYVYLVRAATPGRYRVIPPTAQEFYFPEVYGRGQGSLFVVRPEGS